ncbi:MAG: S-layer homology domain-containing protein [Clostridia bacterium]|nr:S-layer homology domain-containing protein [Clostridia bacterium]
MKKVICLIIVLANIFCIPTSAKEIKVTDAIKNDLFNYEIMIGDENGDLRLKDNITRAEFCKMICVTQGFKDGETLKNTVVENFYDVDQNHWAYDYIQTARGLGLIEGVGNGYFNPDESITVQDSIKIIVTTLGYKPKAEKEGYPNGYINIAEEIGLINKADFVLNNYATREEVAYLIYTSLDIPLLFQTAFGKECEYTVMDGSDGTPLVTVRNRFLDVNINTEPDIEQETQDNVPRFNGPQYTGRIAKISNLKKTGENYCFNNSLNENDTATYIITKDTYVYLSVNTLDLSNIKNDMYVLCWHYTEDTDDIELLKIELMKEPPAGV